MKLKKKIAIPVAGLTVLGIVAGLTLSASATTPAPSNVIRNSFSAVISGGSSGGLPGSPTFGQVAVTCAGPAADHASLPATTSYPIGGTVTNGTAAGYTATGGGFAVGNATGTVTGQVAVTASHAEETYTNGAGWLVGVLNSTGSPQTVTAYVICTSA